MLCRFDRGVMQHCLLLFRVSPMIEVWVTHTSGNRNDLSAAYPNSVTPALSCLFVCLIKCLNVFDSSLKLSLRCREATVTGCISSGFSHEWEHREKWSAHNKFSARADRLDKKKRKFVLCRCPSTANRVLQQSRVVTSSEGRKARLCC